MSILDRFRLDSKVAVVTGASSGLGVAFAKALAEAGADVVLGARRTDRLDETGALVTAAGRKYAALTTDVTKVEDCEALIALAIEKFGRVDILVNNAGIVMQNPIDKIVEEEWDKVLDVNLKGQFLCIQNALPLMRSGSKVVCISSIASGGVGVGFGNIAHYAASKGGVLGMVEDLAIEFGKRGININAVAPGVIESDMTSSMLADPATKSGMEARIPKGRVGKPADIAAAVTFLSTDEADYITGTVIYVDGGWLTN